LSGCVPIYWGADNVDTLIPASCFIDRRNFASTQAVHQYLLNLSEQQYVQYQQHILAFLRSAAANRFDISHYTEVIVAEITKSLTKQSVPTRQ
jgi:alpha(1,3/1,4) fucosyltransferase